MKFALIAIAVFACNLHSRGNPASENERGADPPPTAAALDARIADGGDETGAEDSEAPIAARPFSLAVDETTTINGLEVTFVRVLGDSRCPEGVDCVWAGNAAIEVALVAAGAERAVVELNTNPDLPTRATYRDCAIELLELHPHPRSEGADPGPYRARLRITGPDENEPAREAEASRAGGRRGPSRTRPGSPAGTG